MLKLFDNCAALVFGRGNKTITGMVSSEKEGFEFRNVVPIEGAVEVWMTNVEAEMRKTLFQVRRPRARRARTRAVHVVAEQEKAQIEACGQDYCRGAKFS